MEQEGKYRPTALLTDPNELTALIKAFIHTPTPEIELRLAHFHPQLYLGLLSDCGQPRDYRATAVLSLKALLSQRGLFQPHLVWCLEQLERLYTGGSAELLAGIEGSLELLLEKLFELYLDDETKLKVFEAAIERISRNQFLPTREDCQTVKYALLLVRSMDCSTLNNEVCVGALICYLKQQYQ